MDSITEQRLKQHQQTLDFMVEKGELLLTVKVKSREEAQQILEWMYSEEKPMLSEVTSFAWDNIPVPKVYGKLLHQIAELSMTHPIPMVIDDEQT